MPAGDTREPEQEEDPVVYLDGYTWAKTDRMGANPWNPNVMGHNTFQALKVSMQEGKYDPLLITPVFIFHGDMDLPRDEFIIVDGQWRHKAAEELGIQRVKVNIEQISEAEAREICYKRGKHRGQIDPILEGQLFQLEIDDGMTQEQVAMKYTASQTYVSQRLSLVKVPETVKKLHRTPEKSKGDFIPRGILTVSHMEALIGLPEDFQNELATRVLKENLSVRALEKVVRITKQRISQMELFEKNLEGAERARAMSDREKGVVFQVMLRIEKLKKELEVLGVDVKVDIKDTPPGESLGVVLHLTAVIRKEEP